MLTKIWTTVIILSAAASLVAWVCVAAHARGIRPLRAIARFAQKLSLAGVVVFALMAAPLYRAGSTKVGGGTNNVPQMVPGPGVGNLQPMSPPGGGNVANVEMLPMTNINSQLGNGNIGTGNNFTMATLITSTNTTRTLAAEDFERGFVMTRVGTGEEFDFSPPQNAVTVVDWHAFGAATDWIYAAFTNWTFKVATNDVSRLRIYSFGKIEPLIREVNGSIATNNWFAPFMASLGVVPEANWNLLNESDRASQVWYAITPQGSLLVTWQNALLGRDTGKPISFQIEFKTDGQFIYRYDLSRLGVDSVTNIFAGASFAGNTWATNSMPTNVTLMAFYPLLDSDAYNQDPDNDGLLTIDELFFYNTDPHNADSDYDGLNDGEELLIYSSDPLDPNSISAAYCDGFAAKLGDIDPFSCPEGSTNTVLEHVFYSGTTNGVFAYPTSTAETAVLKIMVSGEGTGRLVVGDAVVPLVGGCQTGLTRFTGLRSGNNPDNPVNPVTNILLLAVGKGVRKEFWFDKPDGLDVALRSGDLLIGRMPTWYLPHGWLAFPHTDATVPCIHDFYAKSKVVTLVHGEEFPGLTAIWTNGNADVEIENLPPVSAEIHGHFAKNQTRSISYTVDHPDRLNEEPVAFAQTLRFCPQPPETEELDDPPDDEVDPYYDCNCGWSGTCNCCTGEWCHCYCWECPCNANQSPTLVDDEDAEEAFTNIVNGAMTPLSHVLYLYRANTNNEHLVVPTGSPVHCCPCPDHWQTNYVAKSFCSRRLAVNYAGGDEEFWLSHDSCDVTVSGVSPSKSFSDSSVLFVTNGATYKRTDYTVLGVAFESEYGRPPLSVYNQKSALIGYPIVVGTNHVFKSNLYLTTDILLTNGTVRVALVPGGSGRLQIWLPAWTDSNSYASHPPELLLDSETLTERYIPIRRWRNIMRRYGSSQRSLMVELVSPEAGACDFVFEFVSSDGERYVHDFANQRITSVNPLLVPDYNRDGRIDSADVQLYIDGRMFRYWINECKVVGAVWEEPSFFEGVADALVGLENWRNGHVDGVYDLINLFPVAVKFGPFLQAWGEGVSYRITSESGTNVFNYTLSDINHLHAGTIRTAPHVDIGNHALSNAPLAALVREGVTISRSSAQSFGDDSCLLIAEAKANSWVGMKMTVSVDGQDMFSCDLPITTSSVDDMYRFVSIRDSYESEMFTFTGTNAPPNNPDSELGNKDVFFVHGFNVSPENARNWNREMFKRFWVSGMNARYWGVTWSGDYHLGWPDFVAENFNGLHYHRDVRQALMTAPTFRNLVNSNGVNSVVIGHSLGNMVVSEALLTNMNASTYIMLDAAVASEAYRPELQANSMEIVDKYVPSDWGGYDSLTWAANWYTWFTNTPNDARAKIGWAGHFAPLLDRQGLDVFNFYSSGDEVFAENSETPGIATGVFHWPTLNLEWPFVHLNWELDAFPWQKQEVFKGVNAAGSLSAGWGFHCWTTNINNETAWVRYSSAGANAMVADGSIVTNAVFNRGVSAMFSPAISDYDKADILAFHIPAVSSPAGKVATLANNSAVDMNVSCEANDWGREGVQVEEAGQLVTKYPWLHSDIKNMAYYYVYPAFTNIVEKGGMK